MLAKRIIPCLDVKNGRVVKGVNFVNLIDAGDPVEAAKAYNKAGADELVFLDITATHEARRTVVEMAKRVAEAVFIPFTVGGGIKSVEDFRELLLQGADKISINSSAIRNPRLISDAAEKFGSQCVVVAIDAKRVSRGDFPSQPPSAAAPPKGSLEKERSASAAAPPKGSLEKERSASAAAPPKGSLEEERSANVYINGGRIDTGLDAVQWAKKVESLGAGEILLTSMDCDGTKAGYDIELTRAIADSVSIPVIASGGAGTMKHFKDALTDGKADAALAASLFHFREIEINDLKDYLGSEGVPVRRS